MPEFEIHPLTQADHEQIARFLEEQWTSRLVVSRGRLHQADRLPGFIANYAGKMAGLVTYRIEGVECEVVSLNSLVEGQGIGSSLLETVGAVARSAGCSRLWLITTNDNVEALRFYQKRGFKLAALHRNALEKSRLLKPSIPRSGLHGIPLRDEIELEMWFN